jgi:hypothetical protein
MVMRFSHFTDGHPTPVKLCPECFALSEFENNAAVEDPEELIPETMTQLLKDSEEIHLSARRFKGHLKSQQDSLKSHLKKLRTGKPYRREQ